MNPNTRRSLLAVTISGACAIWPLAAYGQGAAYTVLNVGTLGGARSAALSINRAGHVVGHAQTSDGEVHAFVFRGQGILDLGTLGGSESYARRVSDDGTVVGRAQDATGTFRSFVSLPSGGLIDISVLDRRLQGAFTAAVDINSQGVIVGYRQTEKEHMVARNRVFIYQDFRIVDLGTFGGEDGVVAAINGRGHVVGYSGREAHADYADHRGILWDGTNATDLGSLGGRMTTPTDVNDRDEVVGYAQVRSGENHGFLFVGSVLRDLGTLAGGTQSFAYSINNHGQAVGASEAADGHLHAVVYADGLLKDLNDLIPDDSGWVLTEARDVNDGGQIVGTGTYHGQQRAFLLTPTP
jgi:probable HAF family extracellular repeat protein